MAENGTWYQDGALIYYGEGENTLVSTCQIYANGSAHIEYTACITSEGNLVPNDTYFSVNGKFVKHCILIDAMNSGKFRIKYS